MAGGTEPDGWPALSIILIPIKAMALPLSARPPRLLRFPGRFGAALACSLLGASLLASCGRGGPKVQPDRPLQVVSTILPITEFTKAVAGRCATVRPLLPAGVGPHDFQARPKDLVLLRQADVLVKNGLGLEGFLGKLIASAENPRLKVIDSSQGVATLRNPDAEHGHGHDHGRCFDHAVRNCHRH
jgi:zinc/manganese transport system substrate-binding protein